MNLSFDDPEYKRACELLDKHAETIRATEGLIGGDVLERGGRWVIVLMVIDWANPPIPNFEGFPVEIVKMSTRDPEYRRGRKMQNKNAEAFRTTQGLIGCWLDARGGRWVIVLMVLKGTNPPIPDFEDFPVVIEEWDEYPKAFTR